MLCTRMHLTERRFAIGSRETIEFASRNKSGNITGAADDSKELQHSPGIVQRPCVLRNLAINCNASDETVRSRSANSARNKANLKSKPPLVIFSLKMQPGIKTLAQDEVKRDPRKLPSFCEHYKQVKKIRPASANTDPPSELIVRGVIPSEEYQQRYDSIRGEDEADQCINELKIQLTDCCHCMQDERDNSLMIAESPIAELLKEENNFTSKSMEQQPATFFTSASFRPCLRFRLHPSPRTKQVISVTMNSKKF